MTASVTSNGSDQQAQAMTPIAVASGMPEPVMATWPARNVTNANVTTF